MKCPNCGAEVTGAVCNYCGSEMPKQPINIINNYYGGTGSNGDVVAAATCPNCGGNKISFMREATATRGVHKTVALCKSCGNTWVTSRDVIVSSKNRIVALLLCIFLGYFGAHQFYVGKKNTGWLYLFTVGLCGIGWIIDIITLASGTFKDVNGHPLK